MSVPCYHLGRTRDILKETTTMRIDASDIAFRVAVDDSRIPQDLKDVLVKTHQRLVDECRKKNTLLTAADNELKILNEKLNCLTSRPVTRSVTKQATPRRKPVGSPLSTPKSKTPRHSPRGGSVGKSPKKSPSSPRRHIPFTPLRSPPSKRAPRRRV